MLYKSSHIKSNLEHSVYRKNNETETQKIADDMWVCVCVFLSFFIDETQTKLLRT